MAHRDNDGRACIQVEDTGPGVEERLLDRIFDPFFTTKEPGRGTGLGLSIVRNIVAQAGGELSFDSAPGQGTTVRVWLPPAPESDRPNRTTQSLRPLGREAPSYRILVVDDDTMVARALTRTLRGHDVTVAHSGQQALQKLVAEDYDVVLCDLMMPETSGMDLYEWSRAQRPALADRFVFMTGGAFTPRARRFVHEHSVGTLEKPFDPRHVRELVHSRAEKARSS
jgi:CheY-like chemotaxis protein